MGEQRFSRRLAAVVAADIVGYSKLMGADEEGTLERLKELRGSLIEPAVLEHHGRIVKTTGDGFLIEFSSTVDAFRFSVALHEGAEQQTSHQVGLKPFRFRVGINVGDIIFDDGDVYGDGVNIAARLESVAAPGAICISERAWSDLKRLPLTFEDLGVQTLKNIQQGIQAYQYTVVRGSVAENPRVSPLPIRISRLAVALTAILTLLGVGVFAASRYTGLFSGTGAKLEVGAFRMLSEGITDAQMVSIAEELRTLLSLDSSLEERLQGIKSNPVRLELTGAARRAGDKINFALELSDGNRDVVAASVPVLVPVAEMGMAPQQLAVKAKSFLSCVLHPLAHPDYRNVLVRAALHRYCAGRHTPTSSLGNDLRNARLLTDKAPNSSLAWSARAISAASAYTELEDEALAKEMERSSRKALSLDTGNSEAVLAKMLVKLHRSEYNLSAEIERVLKQAVNGRPSYCECESSLLGSLLLKLGRVDEAIKYLRVAHDQNALDPDHAETLADALYLNGDWNSSYELVTGAMRTWPSHHGLLHTGLLASIKVKDFDVAKRMIKRHQEMESHTFNAKEERALLLAIEGIEGRQPRTVLRATAVLTDLGDDPENSVDAAFYLNELGAHSAAANIIKTSIKSSGFNPWYFGETYVKLRNHPDITRLLSQDKTISIWRETGSKPDFCREDRLHATCRLLAAPAT